MQALSTKRECPWGVRRHTLVHAAIYLQLAWFSSELVLASTAVALAPRIMGECCLVLCCLMLVSQSPSDSPAAYDSVE